MSIIRQGWSALAILGPMFAVKLCHWNLPLSFCSLEALTTKYFYVTAKRLPTRIALSQGFDSRIWQRPVTGKGITLEDFREDVTVLGDSRSLNITGCNCKSVHM